MSEFKGTQGKWHTMISGFSKTKDPNMIQVYAINDDLEMVCKVYKDGILHNKVQDFKANAQLIASAPELLETLQGIIDAQFGKGTLQQLNTRIAEARNVVNRALTVA